MPESRPNSVSSPFADSMFTNTNFLVAMEDNSYDRVSWDISNSSDSVTRENPATSLGWISTPASSVTPMTRSSIASNSMIEAPESEDILQGPDSDEKTKSRITNLQDSGILHRDQSELRCPYLGCRYLKIFKNEKDLRRHKRKHDSKTPLWYCGCCQNMGEPYEGKDRKDKVREHLRRRHETRDSSGKTSGIECPKEGCLTLFTAESCLDEHLGQEHPGHTWESPRQAIHGSKCDCHQKADARRLQSKQSGTSKHRAASPLVSIAKRGKYDVSPSQSLQCVPQSVGMPANMVPATDSLASVRSTGGWPYPLFGCDFNPALNDLNGAQGSDWNNHRSSLNGLSDPNRDFADVYLDYFTPMNGDQVGITYPLQYLHPAALQCQTLVQELVWFNSTPAEFLDIRETRDFQEMARALRTINHDYPCLPNSITYNPKRETITLKGLSESKLDAAMTKLRSIVETYSKNWGEKYLVTSSSGAESQTPTSRMHSNENPSTCTNCNPGLTKIFPIKVKDDPPLIALWFKSILPALPKILNVLGNFYSASLVRRGQADFHAQPCIQIESPRVPTTASRKSIEGSLKELCNEEGYPSFILIHFSHGNVKNLKGGENEVDDGAEESTDERRLRFNLARPGSKLTMGASLGLWCSEKVSGSLGGYILMDGKKKFMLTSDHFVTNSQAPGNNDVEDLKRNITSPSRFDLKHVKDDLSQTVRELEFEIDMLTREFYGDHEIPEESLNVLPSRLQSKRERRDAVEVLHLQASKPPCEHVIGQVFKCSMGTITVPIPNILAGVGQTINNTGTLRYHLDWALCELESQTGENRHKYCSNEDAMADDPTGEQDRSIRAGDLCHEICEAEPGAVVYYVGQGSGRRSGRVNIPMRVSRVVNEEKIITDEWSIVDLDGKDIQYSLVAGDSGAWVIRQDGNKVMGQVHGHSNKQVLFTPIDAIIADLRIQLGVDASLPPFSPDPGFDLIATPAKDLSAIRSPPSPRPYPFLLKCSQTPVTPPSRPYQFLLKCSEMPVTRPNRQLFGPYLFKIEHLGSSSKIFSPSDTTNTLDQVSSNRDSPSSPPCLTDSPQSPVSTPESSCSLRSSDGTEYISGPTENMKLPSKLLVDSEIPHLALDERVGDQTVNLTSQALDLKRELLFEVISTFRTSTWPIHRKKKIAKARREFGTTRQPPSQTRSAPTSARSLHDTWPWLARRDEGFYESSLTLGPSRHGLSTSPILQDVSEWYNESVMESCDVVA